MASFSITESARAELRRIVTASGCCDPVLTMADAAEPLELDEATRRALLSGSPEEKHKAALSLSETLVPNKWKWRLAVGAFERGECRAQDLFQQDEFTFAMLAEIQAALVGYTLVFESTHFELRSDNDVAQSLMGVKTLKHSPV